MVMVLWAALAQAATVDLRVEPDHLVAGQAGTARVLVITARGEAGLQGNRPPPLPAEQGLKVAVAGQAQQFRQVGGQITQVKQYDYRVTALEPGEWTLGPVELRLADGTVVTTRSVTVEVEERESSERGPDVLLEAGFDQEEAWEGELVLYKYRLQTRLPGASADWQLPEFDGLRQPQHGQPDHRTYVVEDPDGSITVEEGSVPLLAVATGVRDQGVAIAHVKLPTGPRNPFGFRPLRREPYATDRIQLTILPLPTPQPDGFSGLVGDFVVRSEVDKETAAVGESVNWTVQLLGDGALEGYALPPYAVDGVSVYENDTQVVGRVEGSKYESLAAFRRVLVPTQEGTLELPPLALITFSPERGEYVTHQLSLPPIRVTPGREGDGAVTSFGDDGTPEITEEIEEVDFRDIRRRGLTQALPFERAAVWLAGLLAVPGLGLLVVDLFGVIRRRWLLLRTTPEGDKPASSWLSPLPSGPEARLAAFDAALRAAAEIHGQSARVRALQARVARARFAGDLVDDSGLGKDVLDLIAALEAA